MMNKKIGIRATCKYNDIQEEEEFTPFEIKYDRGLLEGVVNVGNLLGFLEWTSRLGLLFRRDGYSFIEYQEPTQNDKRDAVFNVGAGSTPMIKISDRVAFFTDITLLPNVSAGFNIYLGSNDHHADWHYE